MYKLTLYYYDRHGAQNAYDSPSKQTLESEFGTHNEDEVMIKILENGDLQETEVGLESFLIGKRKAPCLVRCQKSTSLPSS